jgi:hypothetical protein
MIQKVLLWIGIELPTFADIFRQKRLCLIRHIAKHCKRANARKWQRKNVGKMSVFEGVERGRGKPQKHQARITPCKQIGNALEWAWAKIE